MSIKPNYEPVPRLYPNCHAIFCATGPSLTDEVVEKIRAVRHKFLIVGVNDAYKKIDFMDEHYACDAKWWKVHGDKINEMYPHLSKWCHDREGAEYGAKIVKGKNGEGFSQDNSYINTGCNSGYQVLNLGYHWGITKSLLVGYNMKPINGQTHFFQGREPTLRTQSPYNKFIKNFNTIQPEIAKTIINCTPNSALNTFYKQPLEEAIL